MELVEESVDQNVSVTTAEVLPVSGPSATSTVGPKVKASARRPIITKEAVAAALQAAAEPELREAAVNIQTTEQPGGVTQAVASLEKEWAGCDRSLSFLQTAQAAIQGEAGKCHNR